MDENKEKDKWYYSKRFTPILIFFAIAIICFASSRAANAPNLVIEQNVVDTQEYLPEGTAVRVRCRRGDARRFQTLLRDS